MLRGFVNRAPNNLARVWCFPILVRSAAEREFHGSFYDDSVIPEIE